VFAVVLGAVEFVSSCSNSIIFLAVLSQVMQFIIIVANVDSTDIVIRSIQRHLEPLVLPFEHGGWSVVGNGP
jgi:hypothetical protein